MRVDTVMIELHDSCADLSFIMRTTTLGLASAHRFGRSERLRSLLFGHEEVVHGELAVALAVGGWQGDDDECVTAGLLAVDEVVR